MLRPAAQTFAMLAGIVGVLSGVDAVAHGIQGTLTAGHLVGVALGTAVFPVIVAKLFTSTLF